MSLQDRIKAASLNKNVTYKMVGNTIEITDGSEIPTRITKFDCENIIRGITRENCATLVDYWRARDKFTVALDYFLIQDEVGED